MTTDLDEAIDLFARAALFSSDGHSQSLALGLKAFAKHLRNSPADGKAERSEGVEPSDEELKAAFDDAAEMCFDAKDGRRAIYNLGFLAGQRSRLDERERAVLEVAREWVTAEDASSGFRAHNRLRAAVQALDSAVGAATRRGE